MEDEEEEVELTAELTDEEINQLTTWLDDVCDEWIKQGKPLPYVHELADCNITISQIDESGEKKIQIEMVAK